MFGKKAKRVLPQGFFFLSVYTLNVNQIILTIAEGYFLKPKVNKRVIS